MRRLGWEDTVCQYVAMHPLGSGASRVDLYQTKVPERIKLMMVLQLRKFKMAQIGRYRVMPCSMVVGSEIGPKS